jgi:MFS family permease
MLFLSSPLWVTELVPPVGRSILAGIVGLFGVIGYILAAYVGVGFFYFKGSEAAQWRAPLALGCAPPLILLCIMKWLPESPRWLISKDRSDEAMDILRKLHTSVDDPNHQYAKIEFHQMKRQHELAKGLPCSWMAMVKRPSYRKRCIIAFMLPVVLYSTGNLVVTSKPS